MASNEVGYDRVVLLHTNGKNNKIIVLVLIVGCPKLGCTGVAGRSPRMHKRDGYRPSPKVTKLDLFSIVADQLKIRGQSTYYRGS